MQPNEPSEKLWKTEEACCDLGSIEKVTMSETSKTTLENTEEDWLQPSETILTTR